MASKSLKDARLASKAWRRRVGFDNIAKAIWTKPTFDLYYSRRRSKA